jgi:hypothetical protein
LVRSAQPGLVVDFGDGNDGFTAGSKGFTIPGNDGQGHFTKKAGAISCIAAGTLDYAAWATVVTTDIDNDGIADIIMDGKYYLKVLRGTGGGNFHDFQVATSYYGTSETERHYGLGTRTNVDVVVQFADGHVTRMNNVAANQTIRVLES